MLYRMSLSSHMKILPGQSLSGTTVVVRRTSTLRGMLAMRHPRRSRTTVLCGAAVTSWQSRVQTLLRHGIQTYDFGTRYLQQGCVGDDVAQLQQFLRAEGLMKGQDAYQGYFGPVTEKAVIKWQQQHDLPATGGFGDLARETYLQKQELRMQHVLAAKQPQVEMTVESNPPLYTEPQTVEKGASSSQWIAAVLMGSAVLLGMVQGWAWWKKSNKGELLAADTWLGDINAIKQQWRNATNSFKEATKSRTAAPIATSAPLSLPEPGFQGPSAPSGLIAVNSPYGTYYRPIDPRDDGEVYSQKPEPKLPPPPPPPPPPPAPAMPPHIERNIEYDDVEAHRKLVAREYGIHEYMATQDLGGSSSSRDLYGAGSSGQSSTGRTGPARVPSLRDTGSYFGGAIRRPSVSSPASPPTQGTPAQPRAADLHEKFYEPSAGVEQTDDKSGSSGWDAWTNLFQSPGTEGTPLPASTTPQTTPTPDQSPAGAGAAPFQGYGAGRSVPTGKTRVGTGTGTFQSTPLPQEDKDDPVFWAYGSATERSAAYKRDAAVGRDSGKTVKPPVPPTVQPPAVPQASAPPPAATPDPPRDIITPVELLPRHAYSPDELNAITQRLAAKRPEGKGGEIWINNMRVVPEGQPSPPPTPQWNLPEEPVPEETPVKKPGTDYKLVTGNPPVIPSPSANALNGNAKQ